MQRVAMIAAVTFALCFAPEVAAQKSKQKDPVLHQYLIEEFGKLQARMDQLNERLAALEAEIGRVRQQQTETTSEVRNAQTSLKAVDSTLTSMRVNTQGDLINLRSDVGQLQKDMTRLVDMVQRALSAMAPAPVAAAPAPTIEGYITAVDEKGVTINLGAGAGVKVGARFNVFRASDPKTQIGVIEVVEVLDANNSRATIVFAKPDLRFEFSDIVRPAT
jgi:uncharacterized small protein (DUF1192 family)